MPLTKTKAKARLQAGVQYDALQTLTFPLVASVAQNIANTVVQGRIILPTFFKIFGVAVSVSAALPTTQASINIVVGTGAETGVAPPNDTSDVVTLTGSTPAGYPATVATAGQSVFAADQRIDTVAGLAADTPFLLTPDNPDAIYPRLGLLTLRASTANLATSALTNLLVTLLVKPYDNNVTKGQINALNAATDL